MRVFSFQTGLFSNSRQIGLLTQETNLVIFLRRSHQYLLLYKHKTFVFIRYLRKKKLNFQYSSYVRGGLDA